MKNAKLIAIGVLFLAGVAVFVFWRRMQPTEKETAAAPSHRAPAHAASTAQTAGTLALSVAAKSQNEIVGAATPCETGGRSRGQGSDAGGKNVGLLDPEVREYVTRRVAK